KSKGPEGLIHCGCHRLQKKQNTGVIKVATYATARGAHPSACLSRGRRTRNDAAISASCANVGTRRQATAGVRRKTPTASVALMHVHATKQVNPIQSLVRFLDG